MTNIATLIRIVLIVGVLINLQRGSCDANITSSIMCQCIGRVHEQKHKCIARGEDHLLSKK